MKHTYLIVGLVCLALSACGIKPKNVSAPEHVSEDTFPREYPDLKTDPAP